MTAPTVPCDCEVWLLAEIADPAFTRRDVSQTYAIAHLTEQRERVDWSKVHAAIVERWSRYALAWIRLMAFSGRCWEGLSDEPG